MKVLLNKNFYQMLNINLKRIKIRHLYFQPGAF
jgi:hypothetical protein